MELDELIKQIESNPNALSNSEVQKAIMSALRNIKSGNTDKLKSAELIPQFDSALKTALTTTNGKRFFTQMIRDRNTDYFVKRNKPMFDALLAGADLATSISQIKESRNAERALVRPTLPNPNVLDPAINNAISQAQQGSLNALKALEPAKQEIAQQKLQDLAIARSVSGGQSGAFGALATGASLRAQRAASALPMIGEQIRRSREQRLDGLLGLRQGQLQNNFNNSLQVGRMNLDQYNQDAAAAAALGSAGRLNLRNTLGRLPQTLSSVIGSNLPVTQEWETYANQVKQSLADRAMNRANEIGFNNRQSYFNNFNQLPVQLPSSVQMYPGRAY